MYASFIQKYIHNMITIDYTYMEIKAHPYFHNVSTNLKSH